ncbi:MAG: FAD:protein FMN transferase [Lachnospiraceae bacterium]|nr:FAD:protein FMN transferase [Lachnospiraceae bacterium]
MNNKIRSHCTTVLTGICALFLCLTALMNLTGCGHAKIDKISATDLCFDTIISVTLYGTPDEEAGLKALLDECMALCRGYDTLWNCRSEDSEIYAINHRAPGTKSMTVSPETADILAKALHFCELSDGVFDITIAPLSTLWDFTADNPRVPSENAISEALSAVDYRQIALDGTTLIFENDTACIDLGGIAKGYIADQLKAFLKENGQTSGYINLGGNILTLGSKPDGEAYVIGVQDPTGREGDAAFGLSVRDGSVVTSGTYERSFEENGRLYHHILDTATGYPIENGVASCTVLSRSSADGDALSTILFALGPENGQAILETLPDIEAIWILDDGTTVESDGAGAFVK